MEAGVPINFLQCTGQTPQEIIWPRIPKVLRLRNVDFSLSRGHKGRKWHPRKPDPAVLLCLPVLELSRGREVGDLGLRGSFRAGEGQEASNGVWGSSTEDEGTKDFGRIPRGMRAAAMIPLLICF